MTQKKIESPCNDVCEMDARTGLCKGCSRTTEEIANWMYLTDAERQSIMEELPKRGR